MGKKSKRSRPSQNKPPPPQATRKKDTSILDPIIPDNNDVDDEESRQRNVPPSMRVEEEETMDNLRFQDPYIDEFEVEEEDDDDEGEEEEEVVDMDDAAADDEGNDTKQKASADRAAEEEQVGVKSWNPLTGDHKSQKLEMDESAYKMHHGLTAEWPSLTLDFVKDTMGDNRTRFPHSIICAVGTQADRLDKNRVTIMKLSDLSRTSPKSGEDEKDMDDEMLGEEYNGNNESDDDDDDGDNSDDEDDEIDLDPILEHYNLRHHGGVNRIRSCPQMSDIVATWSDVGTVNLYDIGGILDAFERSSNSGGGSKVTTTSGGSSRKMRKDPFFTYSGHSTEGYAMDWSRVTTGQLATGDCDGNIHIWTPAEDLSSKGNGNSIGNPTGAAAGKGKIAGDLWNNSSFKVNHAYSSSSSTTSTTNNIDNPPSVEDIAWSPTESTVFATGETGGYVRIYDIRAPNRAMISNNIHHKNNNANAADVNVVGWNNLVGNLLATGGDDGTFAVWDLRTFQTNNKNDNDNAVKPLARFNSHKTPITSLEWHPTDESMIVVTDEDATYIYDLSVEEDNNNVENDNKEGGAVVEQYDDGSSIPPQLLFVHCGSESTKEARWHPQVSSLVMTTALSGFSVFIPSNL